MIEFIDEATVKLVVGALNKELFPAELLTNYLSSKIPIDAFFRGDILITVEGAEEVSVSTTGRQWDGQGAWQEMLPAGSVPFKGLERATIGCLIVGSSMPFGTIMARVQSSHFAIIQWEDGARLYHDAAGPYGLIGEMPGFVMSIVAGALAKRIESQHSFPATTEH